MKKEITRVLALFVLGIIALSFVISAAPGPGPGPDATLIPGDVPYTAQDAQVAASNVESFFVGVKNGIKDDIFGPLFQNNELLTRVFFFILVWMIVHSIVMTSLFKSSSSPWPGRIAGFAISVLAVWFLPANWLTAIRDQYGIMGAVILSVIPFMIILVFSIRVSSAMVGRVVWIFYFFYYFGVYIFRILSGKGSWFSADNVPYFVAMLAGIMIFGFIGAIRNAVFKGEMAGIKESGTRVIKKGKLLHQLQGKELAEVYGDADSAKV